MNKDRREPLGGVKKETFVHSADDPRNNAEMTYDLIAGVKSDLCHELKAIRKIIETMETTSTGRKQSCDTEYIKRAKIGGYSLPVSWFPIIVAGGLFCIAIGYGLLEWKSIVGIIKGLKMIM